MSIDLTAAVEAAARVVVREAYPLRGWGDLSPSQQHRCRELVLPIVTAAAPLIEAALREQIAGEVEESANEYLALAPAGMFESARFNGLKAAARIARGEVTP